MLAQILRRPMSKLVPRDNLVLEYLLEQSVLGTVVKNTAAGGTDGTKVGTPAAFPGTIGNSWNLNAAGTINSNIKTPANAISYSFDLNLRTGALGYIFGDFATSGANESTRFSLQIGSSPPNWGILVGNGSTYWTTTAAHTLTTDVWHKIVITFVGTTIKIYVNGALQHTITAGIARATADSPNNISFGSFAAGGGTPSPIALDNVRLYNRELTATDVAAIYAETSKKDSRWRTVADAGTVTLAQNDRIANCSVSGRVRGVATASAGKRMLELTHIAGSVAFLGVGSSDGVNTWLYYSASGEKYINFAGSAYGATWGTVGDVIGVVADFTASTLTFYKNGVSQGIMATGIAGKTLQAMAATGSSGAPVQSSILNVGESGFAFPVAGAIGWAD